ncbi:MAG: response regulator, partial [Akkermansiaceae bacterium]|nr:response regulator [Akkermansiaceae bacterium]
MPGMDGLEVAHHIQERFGDLAPGILILSSAAHPIPPDTASRLGIARVLTKPVKQSDLLDAITNLFG